MRRQLTSHVMSRNIRPPTTFSCSFTYLWETHKESEEDKL